jgi:hypothetical protein
MRNRATAERAAPRLGVVISILLHLGLVAALFVSFSKKLDIPAESVSVVPVDLVTVGEETNIAPMVKKEDLTPPDVKDIEPAPTPDVAPPKFEIAPDAKPAPKKAEEKFDINDIEKLLAHKKPVNARVGTQTFAGVGAGTALTADLASVLFSQIKALLDTAHRFRQCRESGGGLRDLSRQGGYGFGPAEIAVGGRCPEHAARCGQSGGVPRH